MPQTLLPFSGAKSLWRPYIKKKGDRIMKGGPEAVLPPAECETKNV